jgi:hypothetical protein
MIGELLESEHYYRIYAIGYYLVFCTYFALQHYLDKYSTSFGRLDSRKKMYVVSNLLKAAALAVQTPYVLHFLYEALYLDIWNSIKIRNLGNLYAIPDGVSLLLVRKMSISTKIHHSIVCLFNIISLQVDYGEVSVFRCMPVYASLSTLSYLVNSTLAFRYLDLDSTTSKRFNTAALAIYLSCCLTNWTWHLWYLPVLWDGCQTGGCQILIGVYCSLIATVIWDDLVLIYWLFRNTRKKLVLKTE